ncbi:MAG: DUF3598 family protein [Jaaginema sp. PMC 1079.18]|nr:DUF3598 family protein [Jaaginema sp. PMC 1080.18]MEC4853354.1 DUF3598 family protein [Jaaginema sp. PMC 1079.18]MEC4868518.1 DUF3598 family protein [Jaaginema sp. PMC 1078.18]
MTSQWQNILQNLGEWQGSFTQLNPQGEIVQDTPTVVSLEGLNNSQTIRQVVRRLPPNELPQEKVFEYSSLSRSVLCFENGAFSQGSMQWGPFSEFGAELGLIEGDRRLRLVQLYNQSECNYITLIREQKAHSHTPERPSLTVDQLLGTWEGIATTLYPDLSPSRTYKTHLHIEKVSSDTIEQKLTFGSPETPQTLTSTAQIQDNKLIFAQSSLPIQILLLPDGASSNCPLQIRPGNPFVLEVGWLLEPARRQRLIRSYDAKGQWTSLTLVEEIKQTVAIS